MGDKLVTIADIAARARVSPATAARVIHDQGHVSAAKRSQIERAVAELGYVPNRVARSLRNRRTNLIGHILPLSSDNPFFARIAMAVEEEAGRAGYHVLTAVTRGSPEKEQAMVEDLCGLMVEAIIFTAKTACDTAFIRRVVLRGTPVVMIERPRDIPEIDIILMDSDEGSRAAAEHIAGKGHAQIGYIGAELSRGAVEQSRFNGFMKALEAYGCACQPQWIRRTPDYDAAYGYQAMECLLAMERRPTCVFIASDLLASGVLQCLYQRRLRVPDDISLVGYDNTLSALSAPPLTTIELQPAQVGSAAMNMVVERVSGHRIGAKTVTLSPVLIDRDSVRRMV
jgi:LacI family transcriptional regulator